MRFYTDDFFVKICGITTEEDALMSIACGASAVGFVFAPSTRQVSPQQVHDIVRRLPSEAFTVGVFKNELPERVVEIVNTIGLSAAQLHGAESLDDVAYIAERVGTVIRALPVTSPRLGAFDDSAADYLLLDGERPGSGEEHDWQALGEVSLRTPVIAAGGLTPYNVGWVVASLPVWGVDVSSGVELSPGVKDPAAVLDFVRAARRAHLERPQEVDQHPFDWNEE